MARTLSSNTQAEVAAAATKPRTIVEIKFPTAGTKYYSDQDLTVGALSVEGRVLTWGGLSFALNREASASSVSSASITLRDDDGVLLGYLKNEPWERVKATVYQWFEMSGFGSSDLTPVLSGIVNSPVEWSERAGTVRIDITDISLYHAQTVGVVATFDDFPHISAEDEDRMIPLVYGEARAVEAVGVEIGGRTSLVTYLGYYDDEAIVENAKYFPSGTIKLHIGEELVEGSFNGNKLTITQRGYVLFSGSTTAVTGDPWTLKSSGLLSEDLRTLWGRPIEVVIPGLDPQWRHVATFSEPDVLILTYPLMDGGGNPVEAPLGTPFEIRGRRASHEPGTTVVEDLADGYTWIVNARKSKEIIAVEAFGTNREQFLWESFAPGVWHEYVQDVERWLPMPEEAYEVDLDDTSFNSIPGFEHVTTIRMKTLPTQVRGGLWQTAGKWSRDQLRVWIKGTVNDSNNLIENPANVIRDVLENELGLPSGDIDIPSSVVTALSDLDFGFALTEQTPAMQLLSDLAFQARSYLVWEAVASGPQAKLRALANAEGTSVLTIDAAKREIGGLKIERVQLSNVVTEVLAYWLDNGERRHLVVKDSTAESTYGRQVRQLELWAYSVRRHVHYIAAWWLDRWKKLWDQIRVVAWLEALEVERGDWVTVTVPDYVSGRKMQVIGIEQTPGSGLDGEPDRIELIVQTDGCASSCQLGCELAGCESYCEIVAATVAACWTCETTCQNACQLLSCVTGVETICRMNCLLGQMLGSDTTGGSGSEEPECASSCTTGGCQTACQSACEV